MLYVLGSDFSDQLSTVKSNQTFRYTRCITPKRATSFAGPISASLRPGNTTLFEETLQRF